MGECAWTQKAEGATLTPAALDAWALFVRAQSQWNVGMNGPTGMRYEGIEACARMAGLDVGTRTFELLQLLEGKRLQIWREEREAAEKAAKRG